MKGKRIIILSASLQGKVLNQLHMIHMSIGKTRLLACELIYWINMNADIEDTVKFTLHVMISRQHSLRTK